MKIVDQNPPAIREAGFLPKSSHGSFTQNKPTSPILTFLKYLYPQVGPPPEYSFHLVLLAELPSRTISFLPLASNCFMPFWKSRKIPHIIFCKSSHFFHDGSLPLKNFQSYMYVFQYCCCIKVCSERPEPIRQITVLFGVCYLRTCLVGRTVSCTLGMGLGRLQWCPAKSGCFQEGQQGLEVWTNQSLHLLPPAAKMT